MLGLKLNYFCKSGPRWLHHWWQVSTRCCLTALSLYAKLFWLIKWNNVTFISGRFVECNEDNNHKKTFKNTYLSLQPHLPPSCDWNSTDVYELKLCKHIEQHELGHAMRSCQWVFLCIYICKKLGCYDKMMLPISTRFIDIRVDGVFLNVIILHDLCSVEHMALTLHLHIYNNISWQALRYTPFAKSNGRFFFRHKY